MLSRAKGEESSKSLNSVSSYSSIKSQHQRTNSPKYTSSVSPQKRILQDSVPENFKVSLRVRPPLDREIKDGKFISTIQVSREDNQLCIFEYFNIDRVEVHQYEEYFNNPNSFAIYRFSFDQVYDQDSTQEEVYNTSAKPSVLSMLQGFNATIMAYGQTGTGKTYTMEGFKYNSIDSQRGIIPRATEEIFKFIQNSSNSKMTFMVRASYLQIYNEAISDLLRVDRQNLQIREDRKKGVYVESLSEWAVRTPGEVFKLMERGAAARSTASTKSNDVSSRSHAIFIIIVEQMETGDSANSSGSGMQFQTSRRIRIGKLNLVDLAGSERVGLTGATGKRLEESKKINQSLSCLGNVILALVDSRSRTHIPYRDSKLTRILEDSLGGNCKTTFMAMVSPSLESFSESLSTLKFANRAKNIKNVPVINEDLDQRALLRKYETELLKLKSELEERNKNLFDKTKMLQLEQDKKKAEQDREVVMAALELRSQELLREKEQRNLLEEKITKMNSQLLVGGRKIEETPQFISALERQQKLIREEYERKFLEIEKERQQMEEEKAQVDRYKLLLLKQRDIMIALTNRLNERDETIVQLQEELNSVERVKKKTEVAYLCKTREVLKLKTVLKENNIDCPTDREPENGDDSVIDKSVNEILNLETLYENHSTPEEYLDRIADLASQVESQREEITNLKKDITSQKNDDKKGIRSYSIISDAYDASPRGNNKERDQAEHKPLMEKIQALEERILNHERIREGMLRELTEKSKKNLEA